VTYYGAQYTIHSNSYNNHLNESDIHGNSDHKLWASIPGRVCISAFDSLARFQQ